MKFLRTEDKYFDNLPDYPFAAHYGEVDDFDGGKLRMHFVDEGDKDAAPILLLHGEPSWSFLYRKMIPVLVNAGHRVIAIDLIGFGRSDKPTQREDYSYFRHVEWVKSLVKQLNLTHITLVCQDWGGLIGLRLAAEIGERFARIVAANTMLPTGDHPAGDAFLQWQQYSQQVEVFPAGGLINRTCVTELAESVIAAYDAPFPTEEHKQGARQFPLLVPITPDDPASEHNRQAWKVLTHWHKPFLTAFSDSDPITAGGDKILQKLIPGCHGQAHTTLVAAGHFLQEEQGEALANVVVNFIANNPTNTTS